MNVAELRTTLPSRLVKIAEAIHVAGGRCFLVGGWVRDALLGIPSRDFDVEVYGMSQDALLELLRGYGRPNLVGKSYGVINLYSQGIQYDFSFPRLECKVGVGHRAFAVETREDLDFKTAAARRDFTINAMGMELPDLRLEDPYGGMQDLEARLLRHVGPAFSEDSLRVLRAVQFAARFALRVDSQTVALCRTLDLSELSRERIYEEFRKWLVKSSQPSFGMTAFVQMDMQRFFPWIKPPADWAWEDLGRFLDEVAKERAGDDQEPFVLMLAGLGIGCAEEFGFQAFLEYMTQEQSILRLAPALRREAPLLRNALLAIEFPQDPWIRRLALRVSLSQAVRYVRAWFRTIGMNAQERCDQFQVRAQTLGVWNAPPEPYLTGRILMGLGLKPGKFFGEWIAECFDLQLDGYIQNAEQAKEWAERKVSANGIS